MGILAADWPHYQLYELRSMRELRDMFQPDYDPRVNWIFLSVQGVHGTYTKLDEVEEFLTKAKVKNSWITVLVVQPRLCNLFYGELKVSKGDIPFLRQLVRNTLEIIPKTQEGNS